MKTKVPPEVKRELARIQEFLASRRIGASISSDRLVGKGWHLTVRSPADLLMIETEAGAGERVADLLRASNSIEVKINA